MVSEPLRIKKRGDDGNKIISVRISEATLTKLDQLASETNYSRNELINLILAILSALLSLLIVRS